MSIRVCEEHRDAVVGYEGINCPICKLVSNNETTASERDDFENEVDELTGANSTLERDNEDLKSQIADLEQEIADLKDRSETEPA